MCHSPCGVPSVAADATNCLTKAESPDSTVTAEPHTFVMPDGDGQAPEGVRHKRLEQWR
jgi:hypothetical protein